MARRQWLWSNPNFQQNSNLESKIGSVYFSNIRHRSEKVVKNGQWVKKYQIPSGSIRWENRRKPLWKETFEVIGWNPSRGPCWFLDSFWSHHDQSIISQSVPMSVNHGNVELRATYFPRPKSWKEFQSRGISKLVENWKRWQGSHQ